MVPPPVLVVMVALFFKILLFLAHFIQQNTKLDINNILSLNPTLFNRSMISCTKNSDKGWISKISII